MVVGEIAHRCDAVVACRQQQQLLAQLDGFLANDDAKAERLLTAMDDIYAVLVTMDYPDAITNGLRRQTDIARSIIEKTRGDVTFSLRSHQLTRAITQLSSQLNGGHPSIDLEESGLSIPRPEDG